MTLHACLAQPDCYCESPRQVSERTPWAFDRGRCCVQALDPHEWAHHLELTPGCRGCARAVRATLITVGLVQPVTRTTVTPARERAVTWQVW